MIATDKYIEVMVPLIVQLWPDNTKDEAIEIIKVIKSYTDKTQRLSKYQACQKLNVSRATFDNLVREGVIPRGEKVVGFKELFWKEKTLDEVIKSRRNDNKEKH